MSKPNDGWIGVMMRELTVCVDLGALFANPAFYGIGVAPGDGKLVVIIPRVYGE